MQIIRRGRCALAERPLLLVAPVAADENAALGCFVCVAAAHHINAAPAVPVDSVIDSFQPMIEPSQMECPKVQRCVFGELRFAGVVVVFGTVNPRPDDQSLQALFRLSQLYEIQIGDLRPQESYQPVVWYSGTSLYSAK